MKLILHLFLYLIFLHFSLLLLSGGVHGSAHHRHRHRHRRYNQINGFRPTKLFVFGDSYADTGNIRKAIGSSWKEPYGLTFPGKPAGRFSDGRVLTDYLAKFLGLRSPTPYRWMKFAGSRLQYGMNFAYGGTGVFDTLAPEPNMTTQIGLFEKLVNTSVYSNADLKSSLFLVSLAGNDYSAYLASGGTMQGLQTFIPRVVNQLVVNLKRINALGAKRIAVTSLEPLGCLPSSTVLNSFQQCNVTENGAVSFHNLLLKRAVASLNNQSKDSSFVILDLFSSFTTVLAQQGGEPGSLKFETPLKPCCVGISSGSFCGSVDGQGNKLYTVCNNPRSTFFWDAVHPSEAGWHAVYTSLKATLDHIY